MSGIDIDDAIMSVMGGWLPREHPEWLVDKPQPDDLSPACGIGIQVVAVARNAASQMGLPWNLAVEVGELVQKAIEGVDWLSDDHGCTWEKKDAKTE